MKIEDAIYHRFTPFTLANIKTFSIKIEAMLQVFNSTNGSGKTAFLSQLNVFPLEKSLFFPDGYKAVTIRMPDDLRYRFTSHANGHNSCIKIDTAGNEEELNPGGTQKIQLHLAKEITGLTPFLWNIITGVTKFTTADKTTRRQWMELISGMNFDYAFEVHKRILKNISERRGAVKVSSNHLAEEKLKLLEEHQRASYQTEMEDLTSINRELLRLSRNDQANIGQLVEKVRRGRVEVNELFEKVRKFKRNNALKTTFIAVEDLADVSASINLKQHTINHTHDTLKLLNDQLAEKVELRNRLKRTDGYNLEKVASLTNQGNAKREQLLSSLPADAKRVFSEETSSVWLQQLEAIKSVQTDVYNWKERYSALESLEFPYPTEVYNQHTSFLSELVQKIGRGETLRQTKLEQKHHLEHTEDVKCPKCAHGFKPHTHLTVEEIDGQIEIIDRKLTNYRNNRTSLEHDIKAYKTVLDARNELSELFGRAQLYVLLTGMNFDEESPLAVINTVTSLVQVENTILELISVDEKLAKLKLIGLELEAREGIGSEESISADVNRLEEKIEFNQRQLLTLQEDAKKLTTYLRAVNHLEEMYLSLISKTEQHLKDKAALKDRLAEELVMTGVDKVTARLGQLTTVLNDDRVVRGITDDLAKQIDKYQTELKAFQALDKALNPTTGLIGDQLRECTTAFSTQLTKVVNRIWGYRLEILPCSAENIKGMDYKFPVQSEGYMKPPVPDVSKGSKSQRAVIDLGVQLTTRVALDLTETPLYLDEIGDGMDNVHQHNLIEFIRDLLKEYDCNTLLVHHDLGLRSKLGEHQMVVFEPSNVVVPDVYNEHVTIVNY